MGIEQSAQNKNSEQYLILLFFNISETPSPPEDLPAPKRLRTDEAPIFELSENESAI